MNHSKELLELKTDGRGYHLRSKKNPPISALSELLQIEFSEKGNIDILFSARDRFGFPLWEMTEKAFEKENGKGTYHPYCMSYATRCLKKGIPLSFRNILSELIFRHGDFFARELTLHLETQESFSPLYGIWIHTERDAQYLYHAGNFEMNRFSLPKKYLILHDGGPNGILLGLKK